ncbi:sulfurtransferase complex subunit TusB [Neptuniibacter sp. QD72_48]|uniref:sulfurtransferase complex subunit TusB n=1 Tax=unclassified Neptuniibacter TaxID=2630693 RepID=UPI0039F4B36B
MILHLLNKSHNNTQLLNRMLASVKEKDTVLVIEDGVYAALSANASLFSDLPESCKLFALEPDVSARGITDKLSTRFTLATDEQFVELSCKMNKVVSWF